MIIETPRFRAGISLLAHPDGCARSVEEWVTRAKNMTFGDTPSAPRVAVIGCSGGIGLAARIAATFGLGALTVGVCAERPGAGARTGTPGWYRVAAAESAAAEQGISSRTVVGDAFTERTKDATVTVIREILGEVDVLFYSVAAPRRRDPATGAVSHASVRAIGRPLKLKGFDPGSMSVTALEMPAARDIDIQGAIAVMGGGDLALWLQRLEAEHLLAPGFQCLALTYVGPQRFHDAYRGTTLGLAKDDLERHVGTVSRHLSRTCGGSSVAVALRALLTQASLAMPLSILYTILLEEVLAERDELDDVFAQGVRLVRLATAAETAHFDEKGRLRCDERELRAEVQTELWRRWETVTTARLRESGAIARFEAQRQRLYGFAVPSIDYKQPVDIIRSSGGMVVL